MITVQVRRIGSEAGVINPHSSLLARQLEIAAEGMDRFAPALLELAGVLATASRPL